MLLRNHALKMILLPLLMVGFAVTAFAAGEVNPATGASMNGAQVTGVPTIDANALLQKIADNKGKVVVVNIFASWCPPCREEVPQLVELRKMYTPEELVVIGVSVDKSPRALYTFMDQMQFNYPIYVAEGRFEETVGVTAIPQMLIYDKKGELQVNQKGLLPKSRLLSNVKKFLGK